MSDTKKEQHTFEKYEKNSQVAVLYSPGYGAGWYTWNRGNDALLFDKELVTLVLNDRIDDLKKHIENNEEKYGDPYLGGAHNLKVKWIDKDQQFEIDVYNGSESVHVIGQQSYKTA